MVQGTDRCKAACPKVGDLQPQSGPVTWEQQGGGGEGGLLPKAISGWVTEQTEVAWRI